jgi:hypothetical protein
MVRLTSDAPELLLAEHLDGAQAILIFRWRIWRQSVCEREREIIEHCGQIGGRFEMPYAVGAQLITTRATAAGERRVKQNAVMGSLKAAIGVVVTGWLRPGVQECGVRPCTVSNRR